MKPLPPVIIVADRGRLIAYRNSEGDRLQAINSAEFEEGNLKLSEMVTDQAGAFPNPGCHGTSSAERLPLVAEMEVRCFRQIAESIHRILAAENPRWWGLAAPSEIHGAIVDFLQPADRESLSLQVRRDLVNSSPAAVEEACRRSAVEA
jgi:Protein required for attachment to host cells